MSKKNLRAFKKRCLQMFGSIYPVALSCVFEWNCKFKTNQLWPFTRHGTAVMTPTRNIYCCFLLNNQNFAHTISCIYIYIYVCVCVCVCGPGSSVGIATDYGLDGPGSNPGGDEISPPPVQTGPGAHPASCKIGTGSFPGVKCGRVVLLTHSPPSSSVAVI